MATKLEDLCNCGEPEHPHVRHHISCPPKEKELVLPSANSIQLKVMQLQGMAADLGHQADLLRTMAEDICPHKDEQGTWAIEPNKRPKDWPICTYCRKPGIFIPEYAKEKR